MRETDVRRLHERMGKVAGQPINVSSFTNKRLTINYRVPLERLRALVPDCLEAEDGEAGRGTGRRKGRWFPTVWKPKR